MVMKRCGNGHFYDNSKYRQCPYCGISSDASKIMPIISNTAPPNMPNTSTVGKTVAMPGNIPVSSSAASFDDVKTVGMLPDKGGIDPVVGWVVCVKGASKGQDYRIKSERNFIGRSPSMDISIQGDNRISRENHAIISYNPKNNRFMLLPGGSHGLVYLNDEELLSPAELLRGDVIEIGDTHLMFIPFCGEDIKW